MSKITIAKWTGGVAQVVEHLLCKCNSQSSKLQFHKKKKKKKKNLKGAVLALKSQALSVFLLHHP
jgi:hypothetical protein